MTEKLYDTDSHLSEFKATVLSCEDLGERYAAVLDKTAFFPEGGGQDSDKGTIGEANVTDVQINEEIVHFLDKPLNVGTEYLCKLDWKRRFRNMQNHSGEHIISGIVHKLYGFNNIGFHLSEEMTMDFDGELTREQLNEIEQLANEVVFKNLPVTAYYPTESELITLDYRSKLDLKENVRIVNIKDCDICACCAPHVNFTGEIGMIKILDFFRNKGGVRLFVKCGSDALEDYRVKYENILKISNLLSAKQFETANAVQRLEEDNKSLKYEIGELKKRLIKEKARNFTPLSPVTAVFEDNLDIKELQLFADALYKKSGGIRAVFSGVNSCFSFAICGEENNLSEFFAEFKQSLTVRGGGRNGIVQGTVSNTKAEIEKLFK